MMRAPRRYFARPAAAFVALLVVGCATPVNMFSTGSEAAEQTAGLAWLMIVVSTAIFVAVVVIMLVSIARRRRRDATSVALDERGNGWVLWGGVIMPVAVLTTISAVAVKVLRDPPAPMNAATILITGHQWWWQLDYDVADTHTRFRSANELHIPVGRPVLLRLTTKDVIHSFWVPSLSGKMDLLPGDTNQLRIEARRAGTYRGVCAEYCGAQHAHMAITVVAQDAPAFLAWAHAQSAAAGVVADSLAARGERLFTSGACATCHSVRGTQAKGEIGPDLTHVASRTTIAAGMLPTTLGAIAGWITNPQALKPGAAMPTLDTYSGPDVRAIAEYIRSLR